MGKLHALYSLKTLVDSCDKVLDATRPHTFMGPGVPGHTATGKSEESADYSESLEMF